MEKPNNNPVQILLRNTAYFLVLALAVTYLALSGSIALIAIAVALCYFATALYLKRAGKIVDLAESVKKLPKLLAVLGIFIAVFAAVSGLISIIVFNIVKTPSPVALVNLLIAIFAILTLPFLIAAFTEYAGGERYIGPLFKKSIRMDAFLYFRYLGIGAVSFIISGLIRYFIPIVIIDLILSAFVLGAALLLAFRIYEKRREAK